MCELNCVQLFVTPRTVAPQAPLPMGFSRQESWSGLPFPSPGDLPDPGIKPTSPKSPSLAGNYWATWESQNAPTKRHRLVEWIQKHDFYTYIHIYIYIYIYVCIYICIYMSQELEILALERKHWVSVLSNSHELQLYIYKEQHSILTLGIWSQP